MNPAAAARIRTDDRAAASSCQVHPGDRAAAIDCPVHCGDRATLGNVSGGTLPGGVGVADVSAVEPGNGSGRKVDCAEPDCGTVGSVFDRYTDCVCREIGRRRGEIAASAPVDTLYFGGGTPSFLPLECLQRIVAALGGGGWSEFTVEVNPEDIVSRGEGYVSALRELGVNRVSMGVQSLDDGVLKWMNRRHSADGARRAYELLRSAGMDNVSVDIIFGIGLPGFRDTLVRTVDEILEWRPDHISAYQLSIEEGSALARMVERGLYTEADEAECREQYDYLCGRLSSYHHYEISNWALPGREAVHNSAYWTRAPYVGLGPGAHSLRVDADGKQYRSWNSERLCDWEPSCELLTDKEIREERIMLGLRTDKGVDGKCIPESDWFISDSIISEMF